MLNLVFLVIIPITFAVILLAALYRHLKIDRKYLLNIGLCILVISSSLYHYLGNSDNIRRKILLDEYLDFRDNNKNTANYNKDLVSRLKILGMELEACAPCNIVISEDYYKIGDKNAAYRHAKLAYKLDSSNSRYALYYLNLALIKDADFLESREARDILHNIENNDNTSDSDRTVAYNLLALSYYSTHDWARAIKYWQKTIELLPKDSKHLANIYKSKKNAELLLKQKNN